MVEPDHNLRLREMFLECYPARLEAAGASGKLIVDWLRAHHFALMAIDEKARRLVPADSIDLRTPSFGGGWSAHSTSTARAIKTRPKMSTHRNTILVATNLIPYPPAHRCLPPNFEVIEMATR